MMARRRHGFEYPLHQLQISAWCVLSFYAVSLVVVLPAFTSFALTITCATLLLLTFSSGMVTTLVDPSDASVLNEAAFSVGEGNEKTKGSSHPYQHPQQQQQGSVYCDICQANVQKGTAHCRICSKCIAGFDHHCAWLNTCIGQSNHLSFVCTLVSALAVTALLAGMTLLVLTRWANTLPNARESPLVLLSANIYMGLIVIILFATVALAVLLGQLLLFHLFLHCHQLTTYQYVVLQSQQQRNKEKKAVRSRELVNMATRHETSLYHWGGDGRPSSSPAPQPSLTADAAAAAAAGGEQASCATTTNVILSPPPRPVSLSSFWDFSPFSKKTHRPPASLPGDVFLVSDEEDDYEEDEDHIVIQF